MAASDDDDMKDTPPEQNRPLDEGPAAWVGQNQSGIIAK
jgi:hypothetical protein